MKNPASKIILVAAAMAIAFVIAVPLTRAAEKEKSDAAKKEHDAEMLKKYDKNGNGKLDPDEIAAMKADQAKAKAEKEKKKKEGETK